ncbi:hypothetical protein DFH27DRAFT_615977 [Peziza echinospora]|nr:hypothetical protein DFH27DRAFT_615977 [Peziza echinospora]
MAAAIIRELVGLLFSFSDTSTQKEKVNAKVEFLRRGRIHFDAAGENLVPISSVTEYEALIKEKQPPTSDGSPTSGGRR